MRRKALTFLLGCIFLAGASASALTESATVLDDHDLLTDSTVQRELSGNCVPSRQVVYENFENGSLHGWTNGRIASAPVFTKFLGRYGKDDRYPKDPFKTYDRIPRNADSVEFTFDFYEIDSWDASENEYLCVVYRR